MKKIDNKTKTNIIKDLQELDKNGKYKYTYQEIADRYNVSKEVVIKSAKEENLLRYINSRKINPKTRDNIINDLKELDNNGNYRHSYQNITNRYKISKYLIIEISKRENLLRPERFIKINSKTRNNIIKDLQELDDYGIYKYTYQEIADKYNVSGATVSRIAKEENLSRYSSRKHKCTQQDFDNNISVDIIQDTDKEQELLENENNIFKRFFKKIKQLFKY